MSLKVKIKEAFLRLSHPVILKFEHSTHQNPPEGLRKQSPGPTSSDSDSADLGWGLRLCISNKFLGEGDAATDGLRTPFEKHRLLPLSGGPSLAGGEEAVKLDPLLPCYPHSPPATDLPLPPKALFCSSFFHIYWPQAV